MKYLIKYSYLRFNNAFLIRIKLCMFQHKQAGLAALALDGLLSPEFFYRNPFHLKWHHCNLHRTAKCVDFPLSIFYVHRYLLLYRFITFFVHYFSVKQLFNLFILHFISSLIPTLLIFTVDIYFFPLLFCEFTICQQQT